MAKRDEIFEEDIVKEVTEDFKRRQEERKPLELAWRLNMNFLMGNQFSEITPRGEIEDFGKQYFWQEREVFNHIAPMVETRLAKLSRVKTGISVRPATNDDADIAAAKFSTAVLNAVTAESGLSEAVSAANMWSEVCGTAFYKVVWDTERGKKVGLRDGKALHMGDVSLTVCPPFEIFPESLNIADIKGQRSLIHAKAYTTEEIKRLWGVEVAGKGVNVFSLDTAVVAGGFGYNAAVPKLTGSVRDDCAVVIERYEMPSGDAPEGRLTIVAGDKLLFDGPLPYKNGESGEPCLPFAKQVCMETVGAFFGTSIVERTIPVQRAYNIVKNRKHEFMNRLTAGILTVEDGSIDTDNLEEEGLSPGKVIVYRQGSNPPRLLDGGNVPYDFSSEENKLLQEFVLISGVSEIIKSNELPKQVSSGKAISLLIEQDDTKIALTADSIRAAVKEIGRQILRLYKQFAGEKRLKRIAGENGSVEMIAFSGNDISADDVVFDTENELADTPANRKNMVVELLRMGLLADENGKLAGRTKAKLLEMLGLGNWESAKDIDELHLKKAQRENRMLEKEDTTPHSYDAHELHIAEHTKVLLAESADKKTNFAERVLRHINKHKELAVLDLEAARLTKEMALPEGGGKI